MPRPTVCPFGDCHSPDIQLEQGEVPLESAPTGRRIAHKRDYVTRWVWVCGACGRRLGIAPEPG